MVLEPGYLITEGTGSSCGGRIRVGSLLSDPSELVLQSLDLTLKLCLLLAQPLDRTLLRFDEREQSPEGTDIAHLELVLFLDARSQSGVGAPNRIRIGDRRGDEVQHWGGRFRTDRENTQAMAVFELERGRLRRDFSPEPVNAEALLEFVRIVEDDDGSVGQLGPESLEVVLDIVISMSTVNVQ